MIRPAKQHTKDLQGKSFTKLGKKFTANKKIFGIYMGGMLHTSPSVGFLPLCGTKDNVINLIITNKFYHIIFCNNSTLKIAYVTCVKI